MGKIKSKKDLWREYKCEVELLRSNLSLRRVRAKTGRAINTLRKLKKVFNICTPI